MTSKEEFWEWWRANHEAFRVSPAALAEATWQAAQQHAYEFIHDEIIDPCETADECRDAVSNYYNNHIAGDES